MKEYAKKTKEKIKKQKKKKEKESTFFRLLFLLSPVYFLLIWRGVLNRRRIPDKRY